MLTGKESVDVWADGLHSNVRLEDDRVCWLVLIGVTKEGRKELVAVWDGTRESELSWLEVLRDLKCRGLTIASKLAVGDGALGFWVALRQEWPSTRESTAADCWVHKTANVLNALPKALPPKATARLHDIWMAAATTSSDATSDHPMDFRWAAGWLGFRWTSTQLERRRIVGIGSDVDGIHFRIRSAVVPLTFRWVFVGMS